MAILRTKDENGNWVEANDLSARAYTDVKFDELDPSKKQYEYICTVKVAPDADGTLPNKITLSADDNGNPFELTDFYLDAQKIAITSGNISAFINNNYIFGNASIYSVVNETLRKWFIWYISFGEDRGGYLTYPADAIGATASYPNSNISNHRIISVQPNINKSSNYKYNSIKSISLFCTTGTSTFIEGTTLVLWGVRK